jgi:hypothetical protein
VAVASGHLPRARIEGRCLRHRAVAADTEFDRPGVPGALPHPPGGRTAGRSPPLAAFLRRHAYSGHRTPAALLARLRAAPLAVNILDPKVLVACVGAQVQLLRTLLAASTDLDRALITALGAHPKTAVLAAMPRIGQINLA